jgi:hypothetical protein
MARHHLGQSRVDQHARTKRQKDNNPGNDPSSFHGTYPFDDEK